MMFGRRETKRESPASVPEPPQDNLRKWKEIAHEWIESQTAGSLGIESASTEMLQNMMKAATAMPLGVALSIILAVAEERIRRDGAALP